MAFGRILIDLCTQQDFLLPTGLHPIADQDNTVRQMKRVVAWARQRRVPIVSAVHARRRCEKSTGLPAFCIDGTEGQRKVAFSLMPNMLMLEADNSLAVPIDALSKHRQVVLRKRSDDFLGNPKADRLLSEIRVAEFVVFGVGIECSIKSLVLGLIARRKKVVVVRDACGYWDTDKADLAVRLMEAKGAKFVDADALRTLPAIRLRKRSWLTPKPSAEKARGSADQRHELDRSGPASIAAGSSPA